MRCDEDRGSLRTPASEALSLRHNNELIGYFGSPAVRNASKAVCLFI